MSKGGGKQTVQQNADPWEGVQPFMKEGFKDLTQLYRWNTTSTPNATPDYYPKSTVAPMSGYTQAAINAQAARGAQGSPLIDAAQGDLTKTLQGGYLKGESPFLQRAINYATQPMIQAYNTSIAPGLDSAFSSAGRYGSSQHANAQGQAADALQRNIGGVAGSMAYQNYGDERNRMLQAGMLAPQLAQQDYFDINQLGASGAALDAYKQSQINADIDRWNYNQDADWNRTKDFLSTLTGGTQWGGSTTTKQPAPNTFTSALGGASTGAGIANLLGLSSGWGTAATGIGALLGAFGGSDRRIKTDVRRIGRLRNGLNVYRFRYKVEPSGPMRIGVMAQEVRRVMPDAVHDIGGVLFVDYAKVLEAA